MNCIDCKNTGKQVCTVCCAYQGGVPDRWEPKLITNADRIRAMSDEELARWIADELIEPGYYTKGQAYELWLGWLKQEVSE